MSCIVCLCLSVFLCFSMCRGGGHVVHSPVYLPACMYDSVCMHNLPP